MILHCAGLNITFNVFILKERGYKIPVTHGVLQGRILGPLSFIIFMNDLPLYVNCDFNMYAYDSTLHASTKTLHKLELILTIDVECVS